MPRIPIRLAAVIPLMLIPHDETGWINFEKSLKRLLGFTSQLNNPQQHKYGVEARATAALFPLGERSSDPTGQRDPFLATVALDNLSSLSPSSAGLATFLGDPKLQNLAERVDGVVDVGVGFGGRLPRQAMVGFDVA